MKGYWNRPEETQKTLKDGWLFTGDLAKMDEDGYFYIVDRKKDMIIAGGYNIYPREVEEVLYQHEAVQEAAVVGVPDPYRGETVAAFLVLKPEYQGKVSEKDIERFCRQNLAAYKVPRIIQFRESLPKSSVGKILRRELRRSSPKSRARPEGKAPREAPGTLPAPGLNAWSTGARGGPCACRTSSAPPRGRPG